MDHPLLAKMRRGAGLSSHDEAVLMAGMGRPKEHDADRNLLRGDDAIGQVHVVLEGLVCRYTLLPNGRRQILALLVPGDVVDLRPSILGPVDHCVCTLTSSRLAIIPGAVLEAWSVNHPRIDRALSRAALVDEAVLRQWLINVGARRVDQRIAHLFLEVLNRLQIVGLAAERNFAFRVTQDDLGAMVGGSLVHVCRVLTDLRTDGVVQFRKGEVRIDDLGRLTALAEFNPDYLHLSGGVLTDPPARLQVAHAA